MVLLLTIRLGYIMPTLTEIFNHLTMIRQFLFQ
nr:MAG TPA: hypothetical protein [Bacteriophage sp.]